MSHDKPIHLGGVANYSAIEPARMSAEERQAFVDEVNREMDRLGITKANERTAESEKLTSEDYRTYINI